MSMTIQSSVKEKILVTPSETSKVENAPAEMLRDMDQKMEKRADDGKANMVTDALSRKERVKPRRVPLVGSEMDEAHASSKEWNSGDDQLRLRWMIYPVVLADVVEGVRDAIGFEYWVASSSGWTKSLVPWTEIEESSLTGPELVLDMTDKVVLIKEKLKSARDSQKSYADKGRKPLEFEVGDRVLLKVSPWKGVGGSPAGIHGLFSGRYCGLAGRMVTLRVSTAGAKGVTTGTLVSFMRKLRLREVARMTARVALEFAPGYAFSVSLLLTPLCCDDIHDVTPRVSALARCDILLVSTSNNTAVGSGSGSGWGTDGGSEGVGERRWEGRWKE
ncbi:hypothetical protein Tco_0529544 [Tanacetum coccineum]